MIHAIPNPTKTISVPVNVVDARNAVKNLPTLLTKLGHNGYTLDKQDDFMGVYVFGKTETLSLGVNITIMVTGNETMTQINIEVARVLGTFDQWYEVTNANRHITNIMNCLSLAMDPNSESRIQEEIKKAEDLKAHEIPPVVSFMIIAIIFFAIVAMV